MARGQMKEIEREADAATVPAELYTRLAAPFESTFRDTRGGVELEYITGEQAVSRLNEVLGVGRWSFRVLQHGINAEADEAWVLGEIVADVEGSTVARQQFGSQKLKRSRASGAPLDIGFDLKGAATDALKKCASLLGVGLYLSRKESPEARIASPEPDREVGRLRPDAARQVCEDCGAELRET